MKRLVLGGVGSLVVACAAGAALWPSDQDPPPAARQPSPVAEVKLNSLPLTQAVLYTNGVGYFEREGTVQDNADIELQCRLGEINDLLKSLVVEDLDRGRPASVTLAGPVNQNRFSETMESFFEGNPTWREILLLARGSQVEVTFEAATPAAAAPAPITGMVISIETPQTPMQYESMSQPLNPAGPPGGGLGRAHSSTQVLPARNTTDPDGQTLQLRIKSDVRPEPTRLQLLTAQGAVTLRLDQIKRVKLLDPLLEQSVRQAMAKLSRPFQPLGSQMTTVRLHFEGAGQRRVRIGYLREQPMWKTSYRLMLDEKGTAQLQGWAIVENPSDEDWQHIKLKLVTGQPVSFRMDLHTSLQPRRPEASVPSYRPFLPQGHAALFDRHSGPVATLPSLGTDQLADREVKPGFGMGGMGGGGLGGGGLGGGGFSGGGLGGGGLGGAVSGRDSTKAPRRPSEPEQPAPAQQVAPGTYFEYNIAEPVSLAQGKTTMVPLLQTTIPAERLSLFHADANDNKALLALRLRNDTKILLSAGPIVVYDRHQLAGEAQLPEVAIGAKTFLTYGVDATLEVSEKEKKQNLPTGVEVRYSTLKGFTDKTIKEQTTTYVLTNRDTLPRQVLIEQVRQGISKLIKPAESKDSDDACYRFQTEVAKGQRGEFVVVVNDHQDWQASPTNKTTNSMTIDDLGSVSLNIEHLPERPAAIAAGNGFLILTDNLQTRFRYTLLADQKREWTGTFRHDIDHTWNVNQLPDGGKLVDREAVIPVKVTPGQPTVVTVVQDKAAERRLPLSQATPADLAAILRDRSVPVPLKPIIEQALELQNGIATSASQQLAIQNRLKEIDQEQTRIRANMKDLPKESPLYKRYLEKFDKQEQEIDDRREEAKKLKTQEAELQGKLKTLENSLK